MITIPSEWAEKMASTVRDSPSPVGPVARDDDEAWERPLAECTFDLVDLTRPWDDCELWRCRAGTGAGSTTRAALPIAKLNQTKKTTWCYITYR